MTEIASVSPSTSLKKPLTSCRRPSHLPARDRGSGCHGRIVDGIDRNRHRRRIAAAIAVADRIGEGSGPGVVGGRREAQHLRAVDQHELHRAVEVGTAAPPTLRLTPLTSVMPWTSPSAADIIGEHVAIDWLVLRRSCQVVHRVRRDVADNVGEIDLAEAAVIGRDDLDHVVGEAHRAGGAGADLAADDTSHRIEGQAPEAGPERRMSARRPRSAARNVEADRVAVVMFHVGDRGFDGRVILGADRDRQHAGAETPCRR